MNQETIKWIKEILDSIEISIIERFHAGTLKLGDQKTLSNMIGDILEMATEYTSPENQLMETLTQNLEKVQIILSNRIFVEDVGLLSDCVVPIKRSLDELERNQYIAAAFQLDVQAVMPLMEQLIAKQEEIRQTFQKAVDIDYSIIGEPSELTLQALEAYHFEIANKQVVAVNSMEVNSMEVNQEASGVGKTKEKEPLKTIREAMESLPEGEKREYLHMSSNNREEFINATKFLKEKGGRFDQEVKAWYIEPGKISREEMNTHKMGEYLQIALQGKEQFRETLSFLKENGARFDKNRESWYLTPESSQEKIKDYLNRQFSEKKSVLSKLDHNKGKLEKGEKQHQKERDESQR